MVLLRAHLGEALRRARQEQGRTLRQVSAAAAVSLGYLSEVERGQKEPSSELLAAICLALGLPLSRVLTEVAQSVLIAEPTRLTVVGVASTAGKTAKDAKDIVDAA
ncbi:MAG: XRE family transcriptional regulator [Candidatus Nanopelagicaceae bacterium]|nr:XRE family transcriptional regulator [Candidatus Nanopelagicaceae bacterium]